MTTNDYNPMQDISYEIYMLILSDSNKHSETNF